MNNLEKKINGSKHFLLLLINVVTDNSELQNKYISKFTYAILMFIESIYRYWTKSWKTNLNSSNRRWTRILVMKLFVRANVLTLRRRTRRAHSGTIYKLYVYTTCTPPIPDNNTCHVMESMSFNVLASLTVSGGDFVIQSPKHFVFVKYPPF